MKYSKYGLYCTIIIWQDFVYSSHLSYLNLAITVELSNNSSKISVYLFSKNLKTNIRGDR